MTGEPVAILLYLASRPTFTMLFVRLDVGVLIVVDSSIAINALVTRKNVRAKALPFSVLNASMFITKMRNVSTEFSILSISAFSAFLGVGDHAAMVYVM